MKERGIGTDGKAISTLLLSIKEAKSINPNFVFSILFPSFFHINWVYGTFTQKEKIILMLVGSKAVRVYVLEEKNTA